MVIRDKLYTADEFIEFARSPENQDRRLELENGVIVEMAGSRPINTTTTSRIIAFLSIFVMEHDLGYVTSPDGVFKLSDSTARLPDIGFVSKERYPEMPDVFEGGPDLAIEVVSPNEDVLKKATEYHAAGTRIVWAVYPDEKKVHILRPSGVRWEELGVDDTLSGEDVVPGFALPVKKIFPE